MSPPRTRVTDTFRYTWGPVMAYLLIAVVLAYGLYLQRQSLTQTQELAARTACETLEARVSGRITQRDTLKAVKANGIILADLGERSLRANIKIARLQGDKVEERRSEGLLKALLRKRRLVDVTRIPPPPVPDLVAERNKVCLDVGVIPEDDPRLKGD